MRARGGEEDGTTAPPQRGKKMEETAGEGRCTFLLRPSDLLYFKIGSAAGVAVTSGLGPQRPSPAPARKGSTNRD